MARRTHDAYFTAPYQVNALLAHQRIFGTVLECCNGDGSISNIIRPYCTRVVTNDIDTQWPADAHLDAASPTFAENIGVHGDVGGRFDFVISNPPFKMPMGFDIIKNAWDIARVGVIMMQRISFAEPTQVRGPWLRDHPISRELVLPRHSFTQDGHSDSVTTAWMIWLKGSYRYEAEAAAHLSLYDAEQIFSPRVPNDTRHITNGV